MVISNKLKKKKEWALPHQDVCRVQLMIQGYTSHFSTDAEYNVAIAVQLSTHKLTPTAHKLRCQPLYFL